MSKIKVLHIITRLDPGGSATNTLETVFRLDKRKYDVFLIYGLTSDLDGKISALLKNKGIAFQYIPELQREINLPKDLISYIKIYQFLKQNPFDIVHTHTSKAGIIGRWAAWGAGVKRIVHTPHGHIFYGYFGKIKTLIFIWIERWTALITKRIITLTHLGTKEHLDFKIAKKEKFVTIYSGIDIINTTAMNAKEEKQSFKQRHGLPTDKFIIGTVARLEPIKGIEFLLEAFAKVIAQTPCYLLIVGDGPQKEHLKQKAHELKIADFIYFAGHVCDIYPWMASMDIFVLPSLNEGMGRVVLEAFVCQKPVIASKAGGLPEIIDDGKTGLLVPPRDVKTLSEAILRLMQDKALCQWLSNQAGLKVGERFSLDKMVRDIDRLYQEIW